MSEFPTHDPKQSQHATISDDDLVLLYYGEAEDPQLAQKVAADAELSTRFDELCTQLSQLDNAPIPERSEHYGRLVWARLSPQLEADTAPQSSAHAWWQALFQPRWSFASLAGIGLVAGLSFWLGSQQTPTMPSGLPNGMPPMLISDNATSLQQASMDVYLSQHLDNAERWLTTLSNQQQGSNDPYSTSFTVNPQWTEALLQSNRLYRRQLVNHDLVPATLNASTLGRVLQELERLLLQQANPTAEQWVGQANYGDTSKSIERLLFQLRVLNRQHQAATAAQSAGGTENVSTVI
jgi:hypothetical protein